MQWEVRLAEVPALETVIELGAREARADSDAVAVAVPAAGHPQPSVLSFIKCRIKAFEIHAGVVRGELPVDLGLDAVSGRLPSRDLVAQDP